MRARLVVGDDDAIPLQIYTICPGCQREWTDAAADDQLSGDLDKAPLDTCTPAGLGCRKPISKAFKTQQPERGNARIARQRLQFPPRKLHELSTKIRRQMAWIGLGHHRQRGVNDAAAECRVRLCSQKRHGIQSKNVASENGIGVCHPSLDPADGHLAGPHREWRRGSRRLGRPPLRSVASPARPSKPGAIGFERVGKTHRVEQRVEAQQPARSDRGNPIHFERPHQHDFPRAEQHGEVVCGIPDPLLGRRQPERVPHRPVEPRARLDRLRPSAVIERADNNEVGLNQSRFEGTEYGKPGM